MKIALVCTRGGHLTEMLQLLEALQGFEFYFVTPHSPRDQDIKSIAPVYQFKSIDANLFRFIVVFLKSIVILVREKTDVIISTGPEIALPFYFWGKLLGMKTIYIESWCRVEDLSITGKIVYHWVDEFWVQWPQLAKKFGPKVKYRGSVI